MRFASEHRAIEGCSPGNAYSISSTPSEHYDGHPQDDDDESCSSMSEFDESEVNFDDFDADDTMTVDQMEF